MKNIAVSTLFLLFTSVRVIGQQEETVRPMPVDTTSVVQVVAPPPPPAVTDNTSVSPYKLNWKADVPIIAGGIGLTALGVKLISEKPDLTAAELAQKTRDKVPFFDRHSAGFYSDKADELSYIPFRASFLMPIVAGLIDQDQRRNYGQVMVLYLETMAITGAMFTMTAGTIHRPRPFVYGTNVPDDMRRSGNNQRSFYAGHTAATAAATFFTAKVFNDFHPDSKARPYVWAAAAAVPAVVGYLRYKAGMHFLSDNLLGYAVGAATGILVPHFHKNKVKNLSVTPQMGLGYQGVYVAYKL